jgi:antitoxin component of MazEF toxin-antitoxin module
MIIARTRKWGNSIGVILPKNELDRLKIGADEEISIEVKRKENPLKDLYEAKLPKITRKEFEKIRKEFRMSKYI